MLTKGPELGVAFPCSVLEEPGAGVDDEEEEDEGMVGFRAAGLEPVVC